MDVISYAIMSNNNRNYEGTAETGFVKYVFDL